MKIAAEWTLEGESEDWNSHEADVIIENDTIRFYCEYTNHEASISFADYSYLLAHPNEEVNNAKVVKDGIQVPRLELWRFEVPLYALHKYIKDLRMIDEWGDKNE